MQLTISVENESERRICAVAVRLKGNLVSIIRDGRRMEKGARCRRIPECFHRRARRRARIVRQGGVRFYRPFFHEWHVVRRSWRLNADEGLGLVDPHMRDGRDWVCGR